MASSYKKQVNDFVSLLTTVSFSSSFYDCKYSITYTICDIKTWPACDIGFWYLNEPVFTCALAKQSLCCMTSIYNV